MLSSCYDPNIPWTTNVQMSVMEVRCQVSSLLSVGSAYIGDKRHDEAIATRSAMS